MQLREKGKADGPVVGMGWDEAQAAIRAGTHEPVNKAANKVEVQPASVEPASDRLDEMTRAELDDEAKKRGVDLSAARTKADAVATLRAPRGA